jgi:membrane-associated protein
MTAEIKLAKAIVKSQKVYCLIWVNIAAMLLNSVFADMIGFFKDFFVNHVRLDVALNNFVAAHDVFVYGFLALIIFCETGLVVTPFLPGDSLLFAAGAVAAGPGGNVISLPLLIFILFCAAIAGDNVNYFLGKFLAKKGEGAKLFGIFTIKKEYLEKTHKFYEKNGGRTIIIARFVPIVRTFAPFVAGVGSMNYRKYITYCVIGGFLWVSLLTIAGYLLCQIEFFQKNFEMVVLGIVGISLLPVVFEVVKARMGKKKVE